ncbi:MAG: ADP-ribosylglycohydrolase family protein [Candidatus Pacebacteria bacterium]|nr:ADP-ribosylglycohydrolase family protein [Candidatus Paceibacterota bacterium]
MNPVRNSIIGLAIGDILGVPVEGVARVMLDKDPVIGPRGYGTHDQPQGTWSDDTSLTLCLADSLIHGYNLEDMAKTFLLWKIKGGWTADGTVFDIGVQTSHALKDLLRILENGDTESLELLYLEAGEQTNGNGSLMRILPLYFLLQHDHLEGRFETIWHTSALTHPHVRSALACLMYLIMLDELTLADSPHNAYLRTAKRMREFLDTEHPEERVHFARLIDRDISTLSRNEIRSSGYVVDTLEATFWCITTTTSYAEAVLVAVNLGDDTDTTASVTGGLAGFYYGIDTVPIVWYETVARIEDIEILCDQLHKTYPGKPYTPSPLVRFLLGDGVDGAGHSFRDVLAMNDASLEAEHDYIQWLFPLREHSEAVWDAPTLTNSDITYITENEVVRANLVEALVRMADFFRDNDQWLAPKNHNHLRITRILKSSRLLLGPEHARAYYEFILQQVETCRAPIDPTHKAYWDRAVGKIS